MGFITSSGISDISTVIKLDRLKWLVFGHGGYLALRAAESFKYIGSYVLRSDIS